jgi:plastocyanin
MCRCNLEMNCEAILRRALSAASVVALLLAVACGGGSTPPAPSPPVVGVTVTITASGVTPKNLQVSPGTQVTFVNNDTGTHDMASNPHPDHTDCPAINQVGIIVPGQSKQTGNLNVVRTCGYHDHDDAQNTKWQGQITIQ